jgi:hypothetical protein
MSETARASPTKDVLRYCLGHWRAIVGALAIPMLCLGCAGTPAPVADESSQLLASGFKVIPATTQQQREHLQTLAPGKITAWQRTGKVYYVYPDASRNQVYVGTQKEYDAFVRRVPGAASTVAGQQATDMASYNRQDAAMGARTQRDLADPYYFWRSFEDLSW